MASSPPTRAPGDPSGAPDGGSAAASVAPDRRGLLAVGGLVLLALLLRLPTAGEQSLWADEAFTRQIVDGSLGHVWSTIQETENTPPLFYLLDWLWTRVVGTGELGMRSFSAVVGALTVVPVVALARRVGGSSLPSGVALAAGALVAVNPLAQWFGQEARSYALFVLLAAVAWLVLLRALESPTPRRLATWALAVTAITWTHYFGGLLFVVGWTAIGLALLTPAPSGPVLRRVRALRPLALPAGLSAAACAALIPVAANQQSTDMYRSISLIKGLSTRIVETPKQFALGYDAPAEVVVGVLLSVVLIGLVVAGAWPRDGRATRATLIAGLAAAIWVLPLLALVGGFDVVLTRNFVLLIPPLVVLAAVGAARLGRRGLVVLAVVGVVQLGAVVAVATTPIYQREDWRGMLAASGDRIARPQLLLLEGYQRTPALAYAPVLGEVQPGASVAVRSVAIVDRPEQGKGLDRAPVPNPGPPGFTLVRVDQRAQWRVFVWQAPAPVPVAPEVLESLKGPDRTALVRP